MQSAEDRSTMGGDGASTVVDERLDSLVARIIAEGDPETLEIVRSFTGIRSEGAGPEDAILELTGSADLR